MSVTSPKDPSSPAAEPGNEKASRVRQRQRLIEACISALYAYGPSRTTVEKVVSIANLSPGIVNFYFESKAAMMVAALEFLANEFDREVMEPIIAVKSNPVRALELLVDLYLDPEIASPRKVSVWYAFWGEASARKEYYASFRKRDDAFAALVHDLIGRLVAESGETHLDVEGVSLALVGALDQLWQDFAYEVEANIDRAGAKRRCKAFLRSVFPRQFGGVESVRAPPRAVATAPAEPFEAERDRLFLPGWHLVGHVSELKRAGDYLTAELLGERALVLRDGKGALRAFRNACRHRPHALVRDRGGRFERTIRCAVEDQAYAFDGSARGKDAPGGLMPLGITERAGLVFVRFAPGKAENEPPALPVLHQLGAPHATAVAADWKVVVEQWLAHDPAFTEAPDGLIWRTGPRGASRALAFPNLLADSASMVQVVPVAAGRSLVTRFGDDASLDETLLIAESTQVGLDSPLRRSDDDAEPNAAIRAFRGWLAQQVGGAE